MKIAARIGLAFLVAARAWALAPAAPASPAPDDSWVRVGVVASAAAGLEGDRPLRFAYRDGERLAQMLGTVGQIDSANLFLIKAQDRAGFRSQLARIGARIADLKAQGKKVFLQFYYSGHGGARKFHLSDGPMPFDEVKQALGGDKADARVYVLDVCFGASFFNAKGFRTAPPVQLQMEMDPAARGEVTISSSSVDEQAYEVRTLGGSIFTSHWIMALRGAGDRNRDGQVTLFEAYNYAYDRTAGYSAETLDRPQHPSFQMDLTGARDMTLARLLRGGSGILFQGCPAGLYNVVDLQRGIQVGELRIPQGEEFTLALEPGRYRVQYQPSRGPSQAADLELTGSAMAHLPFAAFQPQAALPGLPKGSPEAEEDFAAAPAASVQTPLAVFLDRLGIRAWGGLAAFRDDRLARGLGRTPEVDRAFGTQGAFTGSAFHSDMGVDLVSPLEGPWYAGLRVGLADAEYSLHAAGREPLGGLDSAASDAYPVTLDWTYSLSDVRAGIFAGRAFGSGPGRAFVAELGAAFLGRTADGHHALHRPLYDQTLIGRSTSEGAGFRLDIGLGYTMTTGSWTGRPLELGARLAPYYARIDGFSDADAGTDLSASEYGCSLLFTFAFMGQPAAPAARGPFGRSP